MKKQLPQTAGITGYFFYSLLLVLELNTSFFISFLKSVGIVAAEEVRAERGRLRAAAQQQAEQLQRLLGRVARALARGAADHIHAYYVQSD